MSRRTEPPRSTKVLALLHQPSSATGRVGSILRSLGVRIEARYPLDGDCLPSTLADYAGVVAFGGPMSANDASPLLKYEIDWLAAPLRERKPYLGLCLGAQLMAKHLGARVWKGPDCKGELGYHPLRTASLAETLCPVEFPTHVYQWHFDGFDLPTGAQRLAEGIGAFPNQAFLYHGDCVNFQFHPEVTLAVMTHWLRRSGADAATRRAHWRGWFAHNTATAAWLERFLARWLRGELCDAPNARAAPPRMTTAA